MLFLTESDVRALLPMAKAVELMRSTFAGLAEKTSQNQPRRRLALPTGAMLHQLAGSHGAYFGAKIYATHLKHGAYFLVLLYDAVTARPLAMLEANHLGADSHRRRQRTRHGLAGPRGRSRARRDR